MPWYIYALLTPTFYSVSNYFDKFLLEKRIRDPLAITALAGVLSGIVGVIIGFATSWQEVAGSGTWILIGAGLLLIFYLIPYYEAMKRDEASRVAPLFGFIPVFTLILSSVFLHESLLPKQIVGMLVVVIGGFLLSVKRVEGGMFRPRASLWFMLLSSLLYGVVSILFRSVVRDGSVGFWGVLSYEYIGKGIGGLALLAIPQIRVSIGRQMKMIKKSAGILVVNDALGIAAQTAEAFALTLATVPMVNVVGAVQPFMTLTEGLVLTLFFPHIIREDIRKIVVAHKLISIVLIFAGLYLVFA